MKQHRVTGFERVSSRLRQSFLRLHAFAAADIMPQVLVTQDNG
jgi:hypothetical protein